MRSPRSHVKNPSETSVAPFFFFFALLPFGIFLLLAENYPMFLLKISRKAKLHAITDDYQPARDSVSRDLLRRVPFYIRDKPFLVLTSVHIRDVNARLAGINIPQDFQLFFLVLAGGH